MPGADIRIAPSDSPNVYPTVQNAMADQIDAMRTFNLGDYTTPGPAPSDVGLFALTNDIRATIGTGQNPSGCVVVIPRAWYDYDSPVDWGQFEGVTVVGLGGKTSIDKHGASVLNYRGTGDRGFNCGSANAVVFYGVQLSFTNAAFCGTLLDFGRYRRNVGSITVTAGSNVVPSANAVAADAERILYEKVPGQLGIAGGYRVQSVNPGVSWTLYATPSTGGTGQAEISGVDGAHNWFINGNLKGVNTRGGNNGQGGPAGSADHTTTSRLLGMSGSLFCGADRVSFLRAGRAVDGCYSGDPDWRTYSNANTVNECIFNYISQPGIMNPGQGWKMTGNTFESHQDISVEDMPAVGADHAIDFTRSSGCEFSGNWLGDGSPAYYIDFYQAYGWSVHGNYFSRIGASTHPNIAKPYFLYELSGGHSVTGNELRCEMTSGAQVHPPIFDARADVRSGMTDGAVRGMSWSGNKITHGSAPTNYLGLGGMRIDANDWPAGITPPGNGYYVTDNSGTIVSGGGGAASAAPMNMNVVDDFGFPTNGSLVPTASINSLKAGQDGKIIHWPPAANYDLANLLTSTANPDGSRGFQFRGKPTQWKGPGAGHDQVGGSEFVTKLLFPAGVHGVDFLGNGQQGGPFASRLEDLFLRGPLGNYEPFDGLRIRAGGFMGTNLMVVGFGRDNYSVDTENSNNANNGTLINCHSYFSRRHALYLAGTNSNCWGIHRFDANNSGTQAQTTAAVTVNTTGFTLPLPAGVTDKLPSSGRGSLKFSSTQQGFISWTGKTATTLTGCIAPAAVNGVVVPSGSIFAFGWGMWAGGWGNRGVVTNETQNGGFPNNFDTCHGSYNAEGFIFDESAGNIYIMCYVEETPNVAAGGGPFQYRMVLGKWAHNGVVLGAWFGGFILHFADGDPIGMVGRRVDTVLTADQKTWLIRNPVAFGRTIEDSGRAILTGSKGGIAALGSVVDMLTQQGLGHDMTT